MKKFKQFFQEKIILSAVMCVLLFVVLTTATTAWYAVNSNAKAYGLKLRTGGTGGLKVATVPGGEDIMSDSKRPKTAEGVPIISINLKDFKNVQSGRIAPGTYSEMPFYITALSDNIKSYSIKVKLEYEPSAAVPNDERIQIEKMIRDHISVYAQKYTDAEGIVRFRDPLAYFEKEKDRVTAATGPLETNREMYAPIYWVWNYELTDIPNWQRQESLARFRAYPDTASAVRAYDIEDTMLGNYVDDIWFRVYIEGSSRRAGN